VTGAGNQNEGINNNRGIASASNKVVCTCDPYYKCACAPPGRGQKKVSSNAPTTAPAYGNATTASTFTEPPRDPNVSAERGELSSSLSRQYTAAMVSTDSWRICRRMRCKYITNNEQHNGQRKLLLILCYISA
jgi:hypothetical protein